jgi:translation elongation factor EF-Tu-like GTPase
MLKKARSKSAAKKSASRKPAKKTVKKKAVRKKSAVKKTVKRKPSKAKTIVKKKALRKKTAKKIVKKTIAKAKQAVPSERFTIEPGPPPRGIPPVEEPARHEEAVGTVTHYYNHIGVAIVQINNGTLKTGDPIHIQGHTTNFTQPVESMELEHQHIDKAVTGQVVGLRVKDEARVHDIVYLVK